MAIASAATPKLASIEIAAATAREAIAWAWENFGTRCALLSSMQDAVMIDLVHQVAPEMPVVFLDNGYHFPETLQTLRAIEQRYNITVEVAQDLRTTSSTSAQDCCARKLPLLEAALADRQAWISGIRRTETANRQDTPVVGVDRRGKTKISPLAQWSDADRLAYIEAYDVPVNPLLVQGYESVGCMPCTTRADTREEGRWPGTERTECGIHW